MSESDQVWVAPHIRAGVWVEGHFRHPAGSRSDAEDLHESPPPSARSRPGFEDRAAVGHAGPPLTDSPGSGWVSSTWLAEEATDDPIVLDQLRRVFAAQRDLTRLDELALAHSPVFEVKALYEETTNTVYRIRTESGHVGYHKPYVGLDEEIAYEHGHTSAQQPVHEVAAWKMARAMGTPYDAMVPVTVMRSVHGQIGSVSLEMPGSAVPPFMSSDPKTTPIDDRAVRAAAFYDCLIGQQDRHFGNARYQADGGLSLIDHGFAFGRPGDFRNGAPFHQRAESLGPTLNDHERATLASLRADATLGGTASILEPDRVHAMRERIETMITSDRLPPVGNTPWRMP